MITVMDSNISKWLFFNKIWLGQWTEWTTRGASHSPFGFDHHFRQVSQGWPIHWRWTQESCTPFCFYHFPHLTLICTYQLFWIFCSHSNDQSSSSLAFWTKFPTTTFFILGCPISRHEAMQTSWSRLTSRVAASWFRWATKKQQPGLRQTPGVARGRHPGKFQGEKLTEWHHGQIDWAWWKKKPRLKIDQLLREWLWALAVSRIRHLSILRRTYLEIVEYIIGHDCTSLYMCKCFNR